MKASIITIISLLIVLGNLNCAGEKKEQKGSTYDRSSGLLQTIDRAENARKTANLNALKAVIAQYRVEHDRNPQTLDELKGQLGEDFRVEEYTYNPETGEVKLRADLK